MAIWDYKNLLEYFEIDQYSSIEDLKKSYRKLAKKTHPDVTGSDGKTFIKITEAYEWMLTVHKPKPRPAPLRDTTGRERFFRIVEFNKKHIYYLELPESEIKKDCTIFVMFPRGGELRIHLDKGTKLTYSLTTENIDPRMTFHFRGPKKKSMWDLF